MPKNIYGQELVANPSVPGAWIVAPTPTPTPTPAPTPVAAPVSTTTVTGNNVKYDPTSGRILESSKPISGVSGTTTSSGTIDYTKDSGYQDYLKATNQAVTSKPDVQASATQDKTSSSYTFDRTKPGTMYTADQLSINPELAKEYSLKAYDEQNNEVFVRPGEYVPGASLTKKTSIIDTNKDVASGDINIGDSSSGNEINLPTSNKPPTVDFSSIEKNLSDAEKVKADFAKRAADLSASQVDRYQTTYDSIATKLEGLSPEYAKAFAQENTYMEEANIIGQVKKSSEISDYIKTATDNYYKSYNAIVGNGDPASKFRLTTLTKQFNAQIAGLEASQSAIANNATKGAAIISQYFKDNISALEGQRMTLTTAGDMAFKSLGIANTNYNNAINKQLEIIDNQIKEEQAKEDAYNKVLAADKFTTARATTEYNLSPNDSPEVQANKIANAQADQDKITTLMKDYMDAGITPDMSLQQAIEKGKTSAKWIKDTTNGENYYQIAGDLAAKAMTSGTSGFKDYNTAFGYYYGLMTGTTPSNTSYTSQYGVPNSTQQEAANKIELATMSAAPTLKAKWASTGFENLMNRLMSDGNYIEAVDQLMKTSIESLPGAKQTDALDAKYMYAYADQMSAIFDQIAADPNLKAAYDANAGAIGQWVSGVKNKLGFSAGNLQPLLTTMQTTFQKYRLLMTGAAFGAKESKEYQAVMPDKDKDLRLNIDTVKAMKNMIETQMLTNAQNSFGTATGSYIFDTFKKTQVYDMSTDSALNRVKYMTKGGPADLLPKMKTGQCGEFINNEILKQKVFKNSITDKIQAVKDAQTKPIGNWFGVKGTYSPTRGDIVVTNEGVDYQLKTYGESYGHVLQINDVLNDGSVRVTESNYNGDETLTITRVISPKTLQDIYRGALRQKEADAAGFDYAYSGGKMPLEYNKSIK